MSAPASVLKYYSNREYVVDNTKQNKTASIKKMNKFIEQINMAAEILRNSNNTDDEIDKIASLYRNSEQLQYSFTNYNPLRYFGKTPENFTAEQVIAKYESLVKKFTGFKLISIDSSNFRSASWDMNISIEYSDFVTSTAYKYDFGKFRIAFNSSVNDHNDVSVAVTASVQGNNKPCPVKENVYHPHIKSNGSVCIGSYNGKAIKRDILNYDLLSVIYNISSVLCEYNPHSLQDGIDITAWIGNKCAVCQAFISDIKQQVKCDKTYMFMHKECAVSIEDKLYSPFIVKQCASCGAQKAYWIPEDGKVICRECKEASTNVVTIPLGEEHDQQQQYHTDEQDEYDDDDNGVDEQTF